MIQRVNGSLAVSRALGDFEYKNVDGKGPTEQLVSRLARARYVCREGGSKEGRIIARKWQREKWNYFRLQSFI